MSESVARAKGRQKKLALWLAVALLVVLAALAAVIAVQSGPRPGRIVVPDREAGSFWRWVRIGSACVAGGALLAVVYRTALRVDDDLHARKVRRAQSELAIEDVKAQSELRKVRAIAPDQHGRYPLLMGTNGVIRDPNQLRAFTLDVVLETWPALEQLDQVTRVVLAAGGWPAAPAQAQLLEAAQPAPPVLQSATLDRLMAKYGHRPSLTNVLVGEYVDEESQQVKPLTLSIPHSVHILVTGASGQGKSTMGEAMALQLAGLPGVELAAVDYGSGTFDWLEESLRWQIADTPELAVALLRELLSLCNERKRMYKEVGRVRSLDQFNTMTGQSLPFTVCFLDELSALLEHPGTKPALVEAMRTGRKYGLGFVGFGTDFKADTLPSEASGNCQTRVAYWLAEGLSRGFLGTKAATDLGDHEVLVQAVGRRGYIKGLAVDVSEGCYDSMPLRKRASMPLQPVVLDGKASSTSPDLDEIDDPSLPDDERCRILHAAGASGREIERRVHGYTGGSATSAVKAALSVE